jgi:hypothetical protein
MSDLLHVIATGALRVLMARRKILPCKAVGDTLRAGSEQRQ